MNKPILKLSCVVKNYTQPSFFEKKTTQKKIKDIPAIDNLSFELYKGEILGLIGESGCGKTTIGKSILKLTDIDSGSITLFDKEITSLSQREFRPQRKNIQMIFQDLDAALNPNMKISAILSEIIKRHQNTNKIETKVVLTKLITDTQLKLEILERFPDELSGGQKRRVAIASALAVKPKIIIADEPTTGLDSYTQSQIIQLITNLQKTQKLSMILISHDLKLVKKVCQRIAVMYLGNIIEIGDANTISTSPSHPYSALLWQSHLKHTIAKSEEKENTIKHDIKLGLVDFVRPIHGCRFAPRCIRYIEMGKPKKCTSQENKPRLQRTKGFHEVACHFPL